MTGKKTNQKAPKRALNAVDRRYLKAVDILVETGRVRSHSEVCTSIGIDRSTISKMKSEGRSVTMPQLEATITSLESFSNYVFDSTINTDYVLNLMAEANTASDIRKTEIRNELVLHLQDDYENLKEYLAFSKTSTNTKRPVIDSVFNNAINRYRSTCCCSIE